jgi:hypothetical protein
MYYDLNIIASEDFQTFKQRFAFPHNQTFCLQRHPPQSMEAASVALRFVWKD